MMFLGHLPGLRASRFEGYRDIHQGLEKASLFRQGKPGIVEIPWFCGFLAHTPDPWTVSDQMALGFSHGSMQ